MICPHELRSPKLRKLHASNDGTKFELKFVNFFEIGLGPRQYRLIKKPAVDSVLILLLTGKDKVGVMVLIGCLSTPIPAFPHQGERSYQHEAVICPFPFYVDECKIMTHFVLISAIVHCSLARDRVQQLVPPLQIFFVLLRSQPVFRAPLFKPIVFGAAAVIIFFQDLLARRA